MTKRSRKSASPHRVVVLAYEGLNLFEFSIAMELLAPRQSMFPDWYDLSAFAVETRSVTTDSGLRMQVPDTPDSVRKARTIIVPGWRMGPAPEPMIVLLQNAHRRGVRIASICTGAFVLAEAGLLNGRRATTHWRYAEELASNYPAVTVEPDVLYIDEGDIVTSAGSAAGIDMLLHLVRKDFGAGAGNRIARHLIASPHRGGGQAQFIEKPVPADANGDFGDVFLHMHQNLHAEHRIESLASLARMSPRTFYRRFKATTGLSPYEWLLHERVRAAKDLLETSANSIERIAFETGFGAADTFRYHFKRITGTAPSDYRNTFRGDAE